MDGQSARSLNELGDSMESYERIAFLAGSPNRVRLLGELREQSGRGAELARRCSLPRSTVHRGLDGLTSRGWVRKNRGCYSLTTAGAFVLSAYEDLAETISVTAEHESVLGDLGPIGRTVPAEALAGVTVIEATPSKPYAPLEHLQEVCDSVSPDRMRGFVPIASRWLNESAQPFVEQGVAIEMVIDQEVLDSARETHPEAYRRGVVHDNFVLYVRSERIRCGLTIFDDDRVLLGAYNERGVFRGCLDGTNKAFIEWAIGTYEDVRESAHRLEPANEQS